MKRQSHEALILERFVNLARGIKDITVTRGQGADNRFELPVWELTVMQRFQFGDLRLEAPGCTVVIEAESGGGLTNLVKYWPLLDGASLQKRLVLVHLFRLTSQMDYVAHRKLWSYVVERMDEHLASKGMTRPHHWDARMFVYRTPEDVSLTEVEQFIAEAIGAG